MMGIGLPRPFVIPEQLGISKQETVKLFTTLDDDELPIEFARLRLVLSFSLLQCLSILLLGWTTQYPDHIHTVFPILSTFITSWPALSTQFAIMTYLVDVFSDHSATASASLNLATCLFAARGTSLVMRMIDEIGVARTFTVCAIVQLAGLLLIGVQWKFAPTWRLEVESGKEVVGDEQIQGSARL